MSFARPPRRIIFFTLLFAERAFGLDFRIVERLSAILVTITGESIPAESSVDKPSGAALLPLAVGSGTGESVAD